MSDILATSIFHTAVVERSWKTQVTSIIVHAVVIGAAFLITVPVVQELQTPADTHVTLVAPYVAHAHPVIEAPRVPHRAKLTLPPVVVEKPQPPVIAKVILPPLVPPTVVKTPVTPPRPATPEPRIEAEAKAPAPPKPVTKVGGFEDLQAKNTPVPRQVAVGGFGDPRGVHNSDKPQPVLMAKVGSFDAPLGSGQSGGGAQADKGVKLSSFGNSGGPANSAASGSAAAAAANVRTGNFGDSAAAGSNSGNRTVQSSGFNDKIAAAPQHKDSAVSAAAFTPVEILSKPRPSYSEEARGLHLEGQVSLEVVFQASGAVKVVRVIKGLGHGLDEAAQSAALQVRFKPATRGGAPVDTNATISITFELT